MIVYRLKNEFAGYRLKKPILLNIEHDDGVWCLENDELGLHGCGKTLEEALEDLKAVFETLIKEYLLESDENLSEKAIELKYRLLEHVEISDDKLLSYF